MKGSTKTGEHLAKDLEGLRGHVSGSQQERACWRPADRGTQPGREQPPRHEADFSPSAGFEGTEAGDCPERQPAHSGRRPPVSILCAGPPELTDVLGQLCRVLGHRPTGASDAQSLEQVGGKFALAMVVDNAGLHSPFSALALSKLVLGKHEAISVERGLLLGVMPTHTGLQRSYVHHGSSYCQLELDQGVLTDDGAASVRGAIVHTLAMPRYEQADYYDYVSDGMLHAVVESSQAPLIVLDRDWRVWFANLAAQAIFKRPTQLMKGRPVGDLFSSQGSARRFQALVREGVRVGGGSAGLRMQARDGAEFDALVAYNPVYGTSERLWGFTLHDITGLRRAEEELQRHRDHLEELVEARTAELRATNESLQREISDRKRAEEALGSSEQLLRLVVEGTPDHFFYIQEADGHFRYLSASVKRITGRSAERWLRDFPACLSKHPLNERFHEGRRRLLTGETDSFSCIVEILHASGKAMWLRISERALTADRRTVGVQGAAADITEAKRLQDRLFHAQKMESIGRLAGGVAHDLNNLMVGVLGFASNMKASRKPADREYEYLEQIALSAESASDLAKQLLAFARGGEHLRERVCLNDVIGRCLSMFPRISPRSRIPKRLAPDLWDVAADPVQMQQVVINLLENAIEATPERGRLIITTRNVDVRSVAERSRLGLERGRYVRVRVKDEGDGMDEAIVERIFEPFFTTKEDGRGMGLAAVYGIVQDHAGRILVSSKPDRGTTFDVYLPAAARRERVS